MFSERGTSRGGGELSDGPACANLLTRGIVINARATDNEDNRLAMTTTSEDPTPMLSVEMVVSRNGLFECANFRSMGLM